MRIADKVEALSWNQKLAVLHAIEGWTLEAAAERYGTSARIVSNWVRGTHKPMRVFRRRIAAVHGVSAEEIFGQELPA
jgi:transcriptional regulator with XRE-family HTH domain